MVQPELAVAEGVSRQPETLPRHVVVEYASWQRERDAMETHLRFYPVRREVAERWLMLRDAYLRPNWATVQPSAWFRSSGGATPLDKPRVR